MEIRIFSRVGLRRSSGGTEAEEQEVSECLALKSSFSCPHNKHQLALRSPGERTEGLLDLRSPGERTEGLLESRRERGQRVSWTSGVQEREDRVDLRSPGERTEWTEGLLDLRSPGERGQSDGPQDPVLQASQCPSGSPDDL
ncbi:hypothetical protein KUCAC02_034505 [Chaenocephalus aceratus]|nr:hypothetical protein KUCAC02_034505 [Chaenocephalus aceratus]